MVYIINNYNGSQLVGINDKTVNNTATSLRLPGRDYKPYGEVIVENLVWMLQNFSNVTPPLSAVQGQIWYDSSNQELKVWDNEWLNTGKTLTGSEFPGTARLGQLFYHTSKQQLFVFDQSETWQLIAPFGSANVSDGAPTDTITYSSWQAFQVTDLGSGTHSIVRVSVGGDVVAVWSGDSVFTTESGAIPGFTPVIIKPGLNLQTGMTINGVADEATLATNSLQLAGVVGASYMRKDQDNLPASPSSLDLGSAGYPFDNMYANNFIGTASYATTAGTATSSSTATNADLLDGQHGAYYQNAGNINAGTLSTSRLAYTPVNKAGDTMAGTLTLNADPTLALQAATKQYVDNKITCTYGTLQYSTSGFSNGSGLIDDTKNYFDVFPPVGKTMSNLIGFTASISVIEWAGNVDNNDSLFCKYSTMSDRIRVWVYDTEQRALPAGNYLAIWS